MEMGESVLDAVGAGLVHRLACYNVRVDLVVRELVKRDVGYVDEGFGTPVAHDAGPGGDLVCFAREGVEHTARIGFVCRFTEQLSGEGDDGVGCHDWFAFLAHDADPGGDLVCFAREGVEHTARIGFVCRFAEQLSGEGDEGVGCHDRFAVLGRVVCHCRGLGAGPALDQVERALVWQSGLIDVCGYDAGVDTRFTHQLDAARRLGGVDHSWIPSFTCWKAPSSARRLGAPGRPPGSTT